MRILSTPATGRDGVTFYRIKQICNFLGKIKKNDYQMFLPRADEKDLEILLQNAEIFITGRENFPFLNTYMQNYDCSERLIVVDIDDKLWDINPMSDMYAVYGDKSIKLGDEPLWLDGYNINIAENRERLENIRYLLERADVITTTTEVLKESIIEFCGNENVVIVPNALNFDHWKKWDLKEHDEVRIGWTGGNTHRIDWMSVADKLKEIKKAKWIIQGCKWDKTLEGIDYEFHNWVDVEAYPYKLGSLGIDIAVIPLADIPFNMNKSNIKWVEFSSLGIPCVVPNLSPYKEEAVHEKTALIYNTPEEFVECVNRLIDDKELRENIGNNAREYMLKNKDINKIAKEYNKTLKKLLKKKKWTNTKKDT